MTRRRRWLLLTGVGTAVVAFHWTIAWRGFRRIDAHLDRIEVTLDRIATRLGGPR
jgi:hypothetical protein